MRFIDWLRQMARPLLRPTMFPYLLAFAGIGILLLGTMWWPYHLATSQVRSQANRLQQATQRSEALESALTNLPAWTDVSLGQVGPSAEFARRWNNLVPSGRRPSLSPPPPVWPLLNLPHTYPYRFIAAANTARLMHTTTRTEATAALMTTEQFLNHQAKVASALINVLAYNATVDFANFDPASSDTRKRLQRAKDGLVKTNQALTDLRDPVDPTLGELITQIEALQAARDELEHNNLVEPWQLAVTSAQATIISNRQVYQTAQATQLQARLTPLAEQLIMLRDRYRGLQAGHL